MALSGSKLNKIVSEYIEEGIKMKIIVSWMTFSIVLFSPFVSADEFHYNNLLIGDRASGMAGAYTAIADDASGMYYNPAGMMYVTDKNFSASVNAFASTTKKYQNVIGGQPFVRTSNALLANYFGVVKPIGKYKFGFSYAVPDSVTEDLSQVVRGVASTTTVGDTYDFTINLNNLDSTINIGPSAAAQVTNDLAVGLTLYVHKRDSLIIQNQFLERFDSTGANTGNQWTNSYYKLNESGIRPILGITWSPIEKLSLGLSMSKTFILNSRGTLQSTCFNTTTYGCDADILTVDPYIVPDTTTFVDKRKYPLRTTLGMAYFASSSLLISLDVTSHTAVIDPVFGNKLATVDAALGTEYYLNKTWAMRAGVFSNVANTPQIQAGVTNIEEHINLFGGSLSFTHFTGDTSVSLGGSLSAGSGKAQIGDPNEVQDASIFSWTMFLSSSF